MCLISPHLTFPVIFWQLHSSFSRDLSHGREPDGISEMGSQRSFFLKSSPPPACSWPIWRNWLKGRTPRHVILQIYSTDKTLQNIPIFSISEPFPLPPMDNVPVGVLNNFLAKKWSLMRVKTCFMHFHHFSSFHVETIWSIDLIIFTSSTMSNSSIHFKVCLHAAIVNNWEVQIIGHIWLKLLKG